MEVYHRVNMTKTKLKFINSLKQACFSKKRSLPAWQLTKNPVVVYLQKSACTNFTLKYYIISVIVPPCYCIIYTLLPSYFSSYVFIRFLFLIFFIMFLAIFLIFEKILLCPPLCGSTYAISSSCRRTLSSPYGPTTLSTFNKVILVFCEG